MGVQLQIGGVHVSFPFEPYGVQKVYMKKVIECLQKSESGLLESPTGTGKTLCLLCATLAWLEVRKAQHQANLVLQRRELGVDQAKLCNDLVQATGVQLPVSGGPFGLGLMPVPKIIYSSRTHSQLSQVVQELKRSDYKHVKAVVVGSRDQLCLNPEVVKEPSSSAKIHLCRAKVNARTCSFYNGVDAATSNPTSKKATVVDIEDLMKTGAKQNCCPYYLSRSMKHEADIIFMPYNYLLDPKARRAHGIELDGNVVIFDEAHNVEKVCEDSVSVELRSQDLAACISEATQLMQAVAHKEEFSKIDDMLGSGSGDLAPDCSLSDLAIIKTMFLALEDNLDAVKLFDEGGVTFPGNYIFEMLAKVDLTYQKKDVLLDLMDKCIQFLTNGSPHSTMRRGGALQKFSDVVRVIFGQFRSGQHLENQNIVSSYRVHISSEASKMKHRNDLWTVTKSLKQPRTLNYWCFNPGIGMLNMSEQKVRCLILTSGTLSPLNTFASELQIPFPIRLENPHIVGKDQVWVGVVTKGPDGTVLNSSFKNRSNESYVMSLGNTIVNFARIVPSGLLVFFPSYSVMAACQRTWEERNLWRSIANVKTIFVENQAKRDFKQTVDDFYRENSEQANSRGGIFMAVCRGKVSEGLDFADQNGRAVIITGLPFPPWKDPKVTLKMSYLDEIVRRTKQQQQQHQQQQAMNGQEWYRLEALRAVNQAIGRVIRHKDDYGAIILCDARFGERQFQSQLSSWLKPQIESYSNFGPAFKSVNQFFRNIQGKKPVKAAAIESAAPVDAHSSRSLDNSITNHSSASSSSAGSSSRSRPNEDWSDHYPYYAVRGAVASASGSSESRPATGSVFGAMDWCEQRLNVAPETVKKHFLAESSRYENMPYVACKRKKLNVLPPGSTSNPIVSSGTDATVDKPRPSSVDDLPKDASMQKSTEVMLKTMKSVLSLDAFVSCKRAIKEYSQVHDVELFVSTLVSICSDPRLHECLRDLRKFVLADQRQKYDEYLTSNGVSR